MRLWKRFVSCGAVAIVGSAPAHGAGLAPPLGRTPGVEFIGDVGEGESVGIALSPLAILDESMSARIDERSPAQARAFANLPDNTPMLRGPEVGRADAEPLCARRPC